MSSWTSVYNRSIYANIIYCVYKIDHLELYHAMHNNIISLAPDEIAPEQAIYHGASNYVTGCEKGCGFLAVRYTVFNWVRGSHLGPGCTYVVSQISKI